MTDGPFLHRIRLTEPDELPAGHAPASPTDDSPTATDRTWNKEDFPAWYQDNVGDTETNDDPASDPANPENRDASRRDMSDGVTGNPTAQHSEPSTYALELAAVQTLDRLEFAPMTILAGANGVGKSTLLEAIAVTAGFNPEGGSRNLNFATHNTHSTLADHLTLEWNRHPRWGWFLRAETFYGMASHIENDEHLAPTFPQFHHRSHGESFLDLATSRFTGKGLYMLDEPESALSVQGLISLCSLMAKSMAKGSQFIVSTHSPLLMAFPEAAVYELDAHDGITRTAFESLASTAIWRRFFADPASFYQKHVD